MNICYEPLQCCLFEMRSSSNDCVYSLTMNDQVVKEGNTIENAFRIGACEEDPCPGRGFWNMLRRLW